jgi:Cu+-exporting ATPase
MILGLALMAAACGGSHAQGNAAPAATSSGSHCAMGARPEPGATAPAAFEAAPAVGTRAKCPVSGEVFTVSADTPRAEHGGKHYAFCCPGCKKRFEANPAGFAK